jgi:ADP-ribose pyrophosphatase YjhB (NUDIX family)
MKFCAECGQPVSLAIPNGDHLERHVCTGCGTIHYQNPKIIAGCVPQYGSRILLCKRAIEPRRGYWTIPAGFMENGEALQDAAAREALEEALARVQIGSLLAILTVLRTQQVQIVFRAQLLDTDFGVGAESLEVGLYEESEIPWAQIAFRSVEFALRRFLSDRQAGVEQPHYGDIDWRDGTVVIRDR